MSSLLLLTSCGTYTGEGAVVGGSFGAIMGSAIGGISGGYRGRDVGTLIGLASGAMVGAAVGSAADQKVAEERAEYRRQREEREYERRRAYSDEDYDRRGYDSQDSGFDSSNSGDDRIDFDAPGPRSGNYSAASPRSYTPRESATPGYHVKYNSQIEIRNARIIDANRDGILRAGEECRVTFEIMNRSDKVLYDVQPTVFDVTGNKHIHISPNLHVESISPNSGVRYTASILADKRLRDGTIVIRVAVAQGNREITSQVQEFTVRTARK